MGQFTFIKAPIEGVMLIEPKVIPDHRGYFMETWNLSDFEQNGLPMQFVQDNQSRSTRGVLRGLHFQRKNPQGKLVRVLAGEVFDVAVDLRGDSPTCGQWYGALLSGENHRQLYVPEGFAHGFLVLSKIASFAYKCTRFYDHDDEGGVLWSDPDIGIDWPIAGITPILNKKDKQNPLFCDMDFRF